MKKIVWLIIFGVVAYTCWAELPAPPVNQNQSTQTTQYLKDVYDYENLPPTVTVNPNGNRYGRYGQIVRYYDGSSYTLYSCVSSPNGRSWEIIKDPSCHGLPAGGTASQALVKLSATNYDVTWADPVSATTLADNVTLEASGPVIQIKQSQIYTIGNDWAISYMDDGVTIGVNGGVYTKEAEMTWYDPFPTTIRVNTSVTRAAGGTTFWRVYINDVAVGAANNVSGATGTTSEDFPAVFGDRIQVYGYDSGASGNLDYFRIMADNSCKSMFNAIPITAAGNGVECRIGISTYHG